MLSKEQEEIIYTCFLKQEISRYLKGKKELTGDVWLEATKKGLLCGIINCKEKPKDKCQKCGLHYCIEHFKEHGNHEE